MPGTVDDFIQRFGHKDTMDDQDAEKYLDRFASNDPKDSEFENQALYSGASEYLGKLPEPQFQQATQNAYANATPSQQQGLMGSLMRALQGRGVDLGRIFGQSGNATNQMNASQYAQAVNNARQQHPEVMTDVVREQPWLVKAMGNPILMGALGMVASRMIKSRTRATQPEQSSGGRGILGKLF